MEKNTRQLESVPAKRQEKQGIFQRLWQKLDSKMKEKAETSSCCCCSEADKKSGSGDKCC